MSFETPPTLPLIAAVVPPPGPATVTLCAHGLVALAQALPELFATPPVPKPGENPKPKPLGLKLTLQLKEHQAQLESPELRAKRCYAAFEYLAVDAACACLEETGLPHLSVQLRAAGGPHTRPADYGAAAHKVLVTLAEQVEAASGPLRAVNPTGTSLAERHGVQVVKFTPMFAVGPLVNMAMVHASARPGAVDAMKGLEHLFALCSMHRMLVAIINAKSTDARTRTKAVQKTFDGSAKTLLKTTVEGITKVFAIV
jgi:hypothetical protein